MHIVTAYTIADSCHFQGSAQSFCLLNFLQRALYTEPVPFVSMRRKDRYIHAYIDTPTTGDDLPY